jgi:hypothetical protein
VPEKFSHSLGSADKLSFWDRSDRECSLSQRLLQKIAEKAFGSRGCGKADSMKIRQWIGWRKLSLHQIRTGDYFLASKGFMSSLWASTVFRGLAVLLRDGTDAEGIALPHSTESLSVNLLPPSTSTTEQGFTQSASEEPLESVPRASR